MFRSARDIEGAIEEVSRWADSLPGEFAIEVTDHTDGAVIAVTGVLISSGLSVRAWIHVDGSSVGHQYRFHVQDTAGGLVWRHDNHPGHENAPLAQQEGDLGLGQPVGLPDPDAADADQLAEAPGGVDGDAIGVVGPPEQGLKLWVKPYAVADGDRLWTSAAGGHADAPRVLGDGTLTEM